MRHKVIILIEHFCSYFDEKIWGLMFAGQAEKNEFDN